VIAKAKVKMMGLERMSRAWPFLPRGDIGRDDPPRRVSTHAITMFSPTGRFDGKIPLARPRSSVDRATAS
jgi:hypothetical protein